MQSGTSCLKALLPLLLLLLAIAQLTSSAPAEPQDLQLQESSEPAELNPINAEEVLGGELERNKRKLPDATFEAKNAVLGFVFGFQRRSRATGKDLSDAPELDRNNVSFELPDELFTKSFRTVTQVSQAFARLIMNSARRYSRFVLFFKPVFGNALVVKGYEDPTTTTTTTTTTSRTTSATEEADKLNEV